MTNSSQKTELWRFDDLFEYLTDQKDLKDTKNNLKCLPQSVEAKVFWIWKLENQKLSDRVGLFLK